MQFFFANFCVCKCHEYKALKWIYRQLKTVVLHNNISVEQTVNLLFYYQYQTLKNGLNKCLSIFMCVCVCVCIDFRLNKVIKRFHPVRGRVRFYRGQELLDYNNKKKDGPITKSTLSKLTAFHRYAISGVYVNYIVFYKKWLWLTSNRQ